MALIFFCCYKIVPFATTVILRKYGTHDILVNIFNFLKNKIIL